MRYLIIILIIIIVFEKCSQRHQQTDLLVCENTIKEIFRLSEKEKYDSLSLLLPRYYFNNTSRSYQAMIIKPIADEATVGNIPDDSNLKFRTGKLTGAKYYIFTYYTDKKVHRIDSIRFHFIESLGFKKVYIYEVFEPVPTITVPNIESDSSKRVF